MKAFFLVLLLLLGPGALSLEIYNGDKLIVTLTPELMLQMVVHGHMAPKEFLRNAATMASTNKDAAKILNKEAIIDLFFKHYTNDITIKFSRETGDNILHYFSRNRSYDMLILCLKKCEKDKNLRLIFRDNNNLQYPVLSLLYFKLGHDNSKEFNDALAILVKHKYTNNTYYSYDVTIKSKQIIAKLTQAQLTLLDGFDSPTWEPKLSKAFKRAIKGELKPKKKGINFPRLSREDLIFDFSQQGYFHDNILHAAVRNGHLQYLAMLLEDSQAIEHINARNHSGATPLLAAVIYQELDCAKYLIEHGANINIVNYKKISAALLAVQQGNLPFLIYLIEHGARIDTLSNINKGILEHINEDPNHQILNYLIKIIPPTIENHPLCVLAAKNDNADLIQFLFDHGHDIEMAYTNGSTPVMYAAQTGSCTSLQKLIDLGAQLDKFNNSHHSILDYTCGLSISCISCNNEKAPVVANIVALALKNKVKTFEPAFLALAYAHFHYYAQKDVRFAPSAALLGSIITIQP